MIKIMAKYLIILNSGPEEPSRATAAFLTAKALVEKGDEVAIRAFNRVYEKIPIHVILVGEHQVIRKLFNKVKPRFTYDVFENVDDVTLAKLYSSADVFVFTFIPSLTKTLHDGT